jgi:8-oxo-dGTP diphosphatase
MRSRYPIAVYLIFERDGQILLLRRFNTGYEDGNYSLVAGHVDVGETATQAAVREAHEEAGVQIKPEALEFVHVMHRKSNDERVDFFYRVKAWEGDIHNQEPGKCDDLSWFLREALPHNLIPCVREALSNAQKGIFYSEFGWSSNKS